MMKDEVTRVYRHELKYYMSNMEAVYLRNLLSATLKRDVHVRNQDYYIRSLYFDTIDKRDFEEKLLGVSERKKIRLRIYSVESNTVKLEVKNKYENYSIKETVTISREDAERLIAGETEVLLNYDNSVAHKVYACMKKERYEPTVLVDYDREAYLLPIENIRITFDKKVRAAADQRLFSKNLLMNGIMNPDLCILEVKYDHYLPQYVTNMISSCTLQNSAISKYGLARTLFMNT